MTTTEAAATPSNKLITPPASSTAAAPSGANAAMGETNFLSLLTTELKNQDPLNPIDSTASVAQLAQFSALQATTSLSNNFADFESNFAVTQASGLLGKTVTVATADTSGNSSTVSGTVASIQVVNGSPQFTLSGKDGKPIVDANGVAVPFKTSQITGIAG